MQSTHCYESYILLIVCDYNWNERIKKKKTFTSRFSLQNVKMFLLPDNENTRYKLVSMTIIFRMFFLCYTLCFNSDEQIQTKIWKEITRNRSAWSFLVLKWPKRYKLHLLRILFVTNNIVKKRRTGQLLIAERNGRQRMRFHLPNAWVNCEEMQSISKMLEMHWLTLNSWVPGN